MTRTRNDRGQATVFVIGMAMVALAVTFFMVEATRAFLMRRTLQNAADAAAVAGASQLDRDVYYASAGARVLLDPAEAETAVARSIASRGLEVDASVDAGPIVVEVRMRTEMATPLLRFVGISKVPVAVEATAEPEAGPTLLE